MKKMETIEAMEENVALEKLERPAHARRAEDASRKPGSGRNLRV